MKATIRLILLFLLLLTSNLYAESHQGIELVKRVQYWHQLNDLAVQDNHAYIATGRSGLQIVDISDPENPEIVAGWSRYPERLQKVNILGDYAYVVPINDDGFHIINISDQNEPRLSRTCYSDQRVSDIHITGEYGYALTNRYLYVLDMRQRSRPREVGSIRSNTEHIFACDENVYAINRWDDMLIYDVSDPEDPQLRGQYEGDREMFLNLWVADDYAYIGTSRDEIIVIDVSDEEHPDLVARCNTDRRVLDMFMDCNLIYAACGGRGLSIVDVSDPEHPDIIEQFEALENALRVTVVGDNAFVLDSEAGLVEVDISDPNDPEIIGALNPPRGLVFGLDVVGNIAYITGSSGLWLYDVTDPVNPRLVGECWHDFAGHEVHIFGNYAFLERLNDQMQLISIVDREHPVCAAYYPAYIYDLFIHDSIAYATRGIHGLLILDITDILHPVELENYLVRRNDSFHSVFVSGDYAFLANEVGMQVLDISDLERPVRIDEIETPGDANDVYVTGNLAYIADGSRGLMIVDISDPEDLTEVGSYNTRGYAKYVYVVNNYAHIADGEQGLRVIDVSDPEHPAEVAYWNTPGFARDICISRDLVYVADYTNWSIYDCSEIVDYRMPPEWMRTPGDTVRITESEILEFEISAEDINADTLTIEMICVDLPDSTRFIDNGDGNGSFLWQTTYNDEGIYEPVFIVTDGELSDTLELTIVVNHYNPAPCWIVVPRDTIEIMEREAVEFSLAAHDTNDVVITLTISRGRLPDWIEFTDNGDGTCDFSWWTEREDAGTYLPFFIASDGELADTALVTIIVHPYNDAQTELVIPTELTLYPLSPNPFNAITRIAYSIPSAGHVRLVVNDISGRIVGILVDDVMTGGNYNCEFDGGDLAAGLYIVRLETAGEVLTRKVVLVR